MTFFLRRFSTIMSKKALVFLASGTEEMEFVIIVDMLRRGGVNVITAGIPNVDPVKCSRDVNIVPDVGITEANKFAPFDLIVLPGGLGGAKAMSNSKDVGALLKHQESSGGMIGAICAAPTVLQAHNICKGFNVTCYPSMEKEIRSDYQLIGDNVVIDRNLITSRGPGTAFEFGLALLNKLVGTEKAQNVAKGMLLSY